ncbi:MAG: hypothetical protein IIZ13_01155 [Renibacterium sp.]|nr:hypothetical protein [Renibacterium sp.]
MLLPQIADNGYRHLLVEQNAVLFWVNPWISGPDAGIPQYSQIAVHRSAWKAVQYRPKIGVFRRHAVRPRQPAIRPGWISAEKEAPLPRNTSRRGAQTIKVHAGEGDLSLSQEGRKW